MNLLAILTEIEEVAPELYERLDSRRSVFNYLGQKLTATTLPLLASTMFRKAYAQAIVGPTIADIINFAIRLEYLQLHLYRQRTQLSGLSSTNQAALAQLATDAANHIAVLRATISPPVVDDPGAAIFDFSGGRGSGIGPFADYATNTDTFLALAQTLEDLGVRAYKGLAPLTALYLDKPRLTYVQSLQAVEARHSARIRTMRRGGASSTAPAQSVPVAPYQTAPKSWVSGTDNGGAIAAFTAPVYKAGNNSDSATYSYGAGSNTGSVAGVTFLADDNVQQAGISLSSATLPNTAGFPANAFTEAFDEGLDMGTVAAFAKQFTVATSSFFS